MSEYWKSNPRKMCEFCKCWIADNRPSIEFHERGKRHKENVAKRLDEIAHKSREDHENRMKQDDYFREMEEAALKAYKKDIDKNPDLMGNKIAEVAAANNATVVVGRKAKSKVSKNSSELKLKPSWHEVRTEGAVSYYWNTVTGETRWEAPEEGFVTVEEQQREQSGEKDDGRKEAGKTKKAKKKRSEPEQVVPYGPLPKVEPYATWQPVGSIEPVDLQLPEVPQEEYYVPEVVIKKPEVSFSEKTVTLSQEDQSGCTAFRKRKAPDVLKKNMRQRAADL